MKAETTRPQQSRAGVLSLTVCVALVCALLSCRSRAGDVPNASSALQSSATAKPLITSDPACPDPKRFTAPADSDREYPIAEVYRAALMPDTEEARARFRRQFKKKNDSEFLAKQHWPRVRKHVRKYVPDEKSFWFEVCRRVVTGGGGERLYVRSHDPKKSHPPITVIATDSGWKIDFFSF